VVDDGDYQPRGYVRLDELSTWLPMANLSDPNTGGGVQVLIAGILGGFVPAIRAAGIPIATVMRA